MVTVQIANTTYVVLDGSPAIGDVLDQRGTCSFAIYDHLGTSYFQTGQQVTVTDSNLGVIYAGNVFSAQRNLLDPNPDAVTAIQCMDQKYFSDKRAYLGNEFVNQYAGSIVVTFLQTVLAQEGITANYAQRQETTTADFGTGTLTNVVPASNVGDGDLELAPAGTTVSLTETTTTQFNSNLSMSGLDTTGDQLQLASHGGLQLTGMCGQNFGNAFVYQKIWHGSFLLHSGDKLIYNLWINGGSPSIMAGVDFVCTDGTTLRDSSCVDQFGLSAHPKTDLKGYADNQWYTRTIDLTPLAGKTISWAQVSFEGDSAGTYTAYFYDVYISKAAGGTQLIYSSGLGQTHGIITQPTDNAKVSANGYSKIALTAIIVYEQTGTRIANGTSLTSVGNARNSLISWTQSIPASMAIAVSTSIDGGSVFQSVSNFGMVPGLLFGASLTGRTLATQIILTNSSTDPTSTPILSDITWSVITGYVATKADTQAVFTKTADWTQAGTSLTNITASNGNLYITSYQKNWDDGSLVNQLLYGDGNPAQAISQRYLQVTTDGTSQAVSRLVDAGNWQNFTATVDVQVPPTSDFIGFVYRTTGWQNANDTYAYMLDIRSTDIYLRTGTNSSSGGGSSTIRGHNTLTLNPGDWHTLSVVVNGNSHQCFIDGIDAFGGAITDSTYPAAGQFGLRYHRINSGRASSIFDNFGVMATPGVIGGSPAPTWISQVINLGPVTIDRSVIFWDAVTDSATQLTVSTSLNGGAYQPCTNGGVIPGAGHAQSFAANATLQIKIQMQSDRASYGPYVKGLTAWISSSFVSSGTRVSTALLLTAAGRLGSSLVAWNANLLTNTALMVDIGTDGLNWPYLNVANGSALPGFTGQPDPTIDTFVTNTSANYTSTHDANGGVNAPWTWDTANVRLSVTGGTKALLLVNSLTAKDIDLLCDMDIADGGGLVWRVVDTSNYYVLIVKDTSAVSNANTLTLQKVSAGTPATLGTPSTVSFTRTTPHRIRVTMLAGVITVSFDGTQVQQYTDSSPLATGQCGLRATTNSSRFYQLRVQPQGDDMTGKNVYTRQRLSSTDPTLTPQVLDLTVAAYSPDIGTGALIPNTNYSVKASQSQNSLSADIDDAAKQSNYWWRIKNKKMLFQSRVGIPAPWCASTSNGDFLIAGLQITNSSPQYRNTEYVIGGTDQISAVKSFIGDDVSQSWTLDYKVAQATPANTNVPVITVNGLAQTVGIQGTNTGMSFYYQAGSDVITQDASLTPLNGSQVLQVTYAGQVTALSSASDAAEQAAYQAIEGGSGIVEVVENFAGLPKVATDQVASTRLAQYKPRGNTFVFGTRHPGLAAGQILPVFCDAHGLNNAQLLLDKVDMSYVFNGTLGDWEPWYTVESVSGPVVGDWCRLLASNTKR